MNYNSTYEELIPVENRNDYYYGGSIPNQLTSNDYPGDFGFYGCGNSIRSYRTISPNLLSFGYSPYDRSFIPSRQRYYSYLDPIGEEDGSLPYDLNGTGTKISTNLGREYVRNSPPSENMHSYYPPIRNQGIEIKYEVYPPLNLMDPYGEDKETMNERKRKLEEENDFDDIPMGGWKLPASKSPIMEAMAFCAIKRWGIEILQCQDQTDDAPAKVVFRVLDFELYYKYSCAICSKQNPTEDLGSRVKSLRRWFVNFPKKRDRRENPNFSLEVKPDVAKKVYEMIEKYKCQINVKKRRRTM